VGVRRLSPTVVDCRILVGVNDCPDCDSLGGPCCVAHGQAPSGTGRRGRSVGGWTRFESDTILVHQSGTAHQPGACGHLSESKIEPPVWGWITEPGPYLWHQLSEAKPAKATGGNTDLVATHRCQPCSERLG
jgi:hypothetical protein